VIVSSYSFIDASTEDYQEEEVFYQEEEQEHFDHTTNQGKLLPMQARLMQAIISCKLTILQGSLVQSSTRARHHYILLYEPIPSFLLYKLYLLLFIKVTF
jgi:hypothetical protein